MSQDIKKIMCEKCHHEFVTIVTEKCTNCGYDNAKIPESILTWMNKLKEKDPSTSRKLKHINWLKPSYKEYDILLCTLVRAIRFRHWFMELSYDQLFQQVYKAKVRFNEYGLSEDKVAAVALLKAYVKALCDPGSVENL